MERPWETSFLDKKWTSSDTMIRELRTLISVHLFKEERLRDVFQSESLEGFSEEGDDYLSFSKSTDTFYRNRYPSNLSSLHTYTYFSEERVKLARTRLGLMEKDRKSNYFDWFKEEHGVSIDGEHGLFIMLNPKRAELFNQNKEILFNLIVYLTRDRKHFFKEIQESLLKEGRETLGGMVISLYENHPRLGMKMDRFAEKAILSQKKEKNLERLLEIMEHLQSGGD